MITKNYEQLLNQIGGTLESDQVAVPVFGNRGRKARHSGIFSLDNPAYKMMMSATKNQDIDSLYDQAVQWEINNAILQEQRKYEDPSANIARQRAAGFNPDIAGSSAGGSSAGSSPSMEPIQENIPTANAYDTADRVINGINSAVSLISSLANGFSAISQGVATLHLMKPTSSNLQAQAAQAQAQADTLNALRAGQVSGQSLSNSSALLSQLMQLSQIFPALDGDNADYVSQLSAFFPDATPDQLKSYSNSIANLKQHPSLVGEYKKSELAQRWAEIEEQQYTRQKVQNLVEFSLRYDSASAELDALSSELSAKIQKYISSSDFAEQTASNITESANVEGLNLEQLQQQIQHDIKVFAQQLDFVRTAELHCDTAIATVYNNARSSDGNRRALSAAEWAIVEENQVKKAALHTLGSKQLHIALDIARSADRSKYYTEIGLNKNGYPETVIGGERHNWFAEWTWDRYLQMENPMADLAGALSYAIPYAGGVAGESYSIYKKHHPTATAPIGFNRK